MIERGGRETLVHTGEVCPNLLCGVDVRRAIQVRGFRGKEGNDAQQLRIEKRQIS